MKNSIKPFDKKALRKVVKTLSTLFKLLVYISDLSNLAQRSLLAFRVFWFVIERMTKQNAIVVSQGTLAEILSYDKSNISRAIRLQREEFTVMAVDNDY